MLAIKKEKANIKETAKELKEKVVQWNKVQRGLLFNHNEFFNNIKRQNTKKSRDRNKKKSLKRQNTLQRRGGILDENKSLLQRIVSIRNLAKQEEASEQIKLYREVKVQFKKMKKNLSFRAKIYLLLNKYLVNSIIFIDSEEKIKKTKLELERGEKFSYSELEEIMFKEIRKRTKKTNSKIKLKDLHKTQEFLQSRNINQELISTLGKVIVTNSQIFAYFFMLLTMMSNAGFLGLFFPFMVFGFALLEDGVPRKRFWKFVQGYTLCLLIVKFIVSMNVMQDLTDVIVDFSLDVKLGIQPYSTNSQLAINILPETIIQFFSLITIFKLKALGLHKLSEPQYENANQAVTRIMQTLKILQRRNSSLNKQEIEKIFINENNKKRSLSNDLSEKKTKKNKTSKDIKGVFTKTENEQYKRRYSLIINEEQLYQTGKKIKDRKKGFFQKNPYFLRLFPTSNTQKPGRDFYFITTFALFLICIFIFTNYNGLDASRTESQAVDLFDLSMVLFLLLHIAIIITDRFIHRTQIKSREKIIPKPKSFLNQLKEIQNPGNTDIFKRQLQKIDEQDFVSKESYEALTALQQNYIYMMEREKSKILFQQIFKFFFHWALLIFVHFLVFWYFPISGNQRLFNQDQCPKDAEEDYVGCKDFKKNKSLIIFYLLYCLYFTFSGLQIKYGFPQFRREGSGDNDIAYVGHHIEWQIPFLVEIKVLLDWTTTRTALELFQWFQLAMYNSELYKAKMGNESIYQKKFGKPMGYLNKMTYGCSLTFLVLLLLCGPFLLFSDIGNFSDYNPIIKSEFQFNFKIAELRQDQYVNSTFNLYLSNNPHLYTTQKEEYQMMNFSVSPSTKFFEEQQIQTNQLTLYSQTKWQLASETREILIKNLTSYLSGNAFNNETNGRQVYVYTQFTYELHRERPSEAKIAQNQAEHLLNVTNTDDRKVLEDLLKIPLIQCQGEDYYDMKLPQSYVNRVKLSSSQEAEFIFIKYPKKMARDPFLDMTLRYDCNDDIWIIMDEEEQPIKIYAFSAKVVDSWLAGYSLLTFYTGIVIVIGTGLRGGIFNYTFTAHITEINFPEPLLKLCECVHISRQEGNFHKEEQYYHVLVEILRKPELLSLLSGTSLKGENV